MRNVVLWREVSCSAVWWSDVLCGVLLCRAGNLLLRCVVQCGDVRWRGVSCRVGNLLLCGGVTCSVVRCCGVT
jgi:hypothetical protein